MSELAEWMTAHWQQLAIAGYVLLVGAMLVAALTDDSNWQEG